MTLGVFYAAQGLQVERVISSPGEFGVHATERSPIHDLSAAPCFIVADKALAFRIENQGASGAIGNIAQVAHTG